MLILNQSLVFVLEAVPSGAVGKRKVNLKLGLHDRGGCAYSDRVLVYFLLYRLPYLDKLFELCPFMKTALSHENHVDGFFLSLYQVPRNRQF